jgi:hypothetical protein
VVHVNLVNMSQALCLLFGVARVRVVYLVELYQSSRPAI